MIENIDNNADRQLESNFKMVVIPPAQNDSQGSEVPAIHRD